jgi:hypothetical protein
MRFHSFLCKKSPAETGDFYFYKGDVNLTYSSKCIHPGCNKNMAYTFNRLCHYHWDMVIKRNMDKIIKEHKKT